MTNQEIETKVKEVVARKMGVPADGLSAATRLAEDLGVDSFGAVELMFELEEAFGLKIPDSEIEHIRTIGDVVTYLDFWLKKKLNP